MSSCGNSWALSPTIETITTSQTRKDCRPATSPARTLPAAQLQRSTPSCSHRPHTPTMGLNASRQEAKHSTQRQPSQPNSWLADVLAHADRVLLDIDQDMKQENTMLGPMPLPEEQPSGFIAKWLQESCLEKLPEQEPSLQMSPIEIVVHSEQTTTTWTRSSAASSPCRTHSRASSCPPDTRRAMKLKGQCLALVQELQRQQAAESALVSQMMDGVTSQATEGHDCEDLGVDITIPGMPVGLGKSFRGEGSLRPRWAHPTHCPEADALKEEFTAELRLMQSRCCQLVQDLEADHRRTLAALQESHVEVARQLRDSGTHMVQQLYAKHCQELQWCEGEMRSSLEQLHADHQAHLQAAEKEAASLRQGMAQLQTDWSTLEDEVQQLQGLLRSHGGHQDMCITHQSETTSDLIAQLDDYQQLQNQLDAMRQAYGALDSQLAQCMADHHAEVTALSSKLECFTKQHHSTLAQAHQVHQVDSSTQCNMIADCTHAPSSALSSGGMQKVRDEARLEIEQLQMQHQLELDRMQADHVAAMSTWREKVEAMEEEQKLVQQSCEEGRCYNERCNAQQQYLEEMVNAKSMLEECNEALRSQLKAQHQQLAHEMAAKQTRHQEELHALTEQYQCTLAAMKSQIDTFKEDQAAVAQLWEEGMAKQAQETRRELFALLEAHEKDARVAITICEEDCRAYLKRMSRSSSACTHLTGELKRRNRALQSNVDALQAIVQDSEAQCSHMCQWLQYAEQTARAVVYAAEDMAWHDICRQMEAPGERAHRQPDLNVMQSQFSYLQRVVDQRLQASRFALQDMQAECEAERSNFRLELQKLQSDHKRTLCVVAEEHWGCMLLLEEAREWALLSMHAQYDAHLQGIVEDHQQQMITVEGQREIQMVLMQESAGRIQLVKEEDAAWNLGKTRHEQRLALTALLLETTAVVQGLKKDYQMEIDLLEWRHTTEMNKLQQTKDDPKDDSKDDTARRLVWETGNVSAHSPNIEGCHATSMEVELSLMLQNSREDQCTHMDFEVQARALRSQLLTAQAQLLEEKTVHKQELLSLKEQHQLTLKSLEDQFHAVMEEVRSEHKGAIQNLETYYSTELKNLLTNQKLDTQRLRAAELAELEEEVWRLRDWNLQYRNRCLRSTVPAGPQGSGKELTIGTSSPTSEPIPDPLEALVTTYYGIWQASRKMHAMLSSSPSSQSSLAHAMATLEQELAAVNELGSSQVVHPFAGFPGEQGVQSSEAISRFNNLLHTALTSIDQYGHSADMTATICDVSSDSFQSSRPSVSPVRAPPPQPHPQFTMDNIPRPRTMILSAPTSGLRWQLLELMRQYWAEMQRAQLICTAAETAAQKLADTVASWQEGCQSQLRQLQTQLFTAEMALLVANEQQARHHITGREADKRLKRWMACYHNEAGRQKDAANPLQIQKLREKHTAELADLRNALAAEHQRVISACEQEWGERLAEQQQAIEELMAELAFLRKEFPLQHNELSTHDWQIERHQLHARLAQAEGLATTITAGQAAQTEALQQQLDTQQQNIASLMLEKDKLIANQDMLLAERGKLQAQANMLLTQLAEKQKQCEVLQKQMELSGRTTPPATYRDPLQNSMAACEQLRHELNVQRGLLAQRDQTILNLQRLLDWLAKERSAMHETLAHSDAEVQQVRILLKQLGYDDNQAAGPPGSSLTGGEDESPARAWPRYQQQSQQQPQQQQQQQWRSQWPTGIRSMPGSHQVEENTSIQVAPVTTVVPDNSIQLELEQRLRATDAHLRYLHAEVEAYQQSSLEREAELAEQKQLLQEAQRQLMWDAARLRGEKQVVSLERDAVARKAAALETKLRQKLNGVRQRDSPRGSPARQSSTR